MAKRKEIKFKREGRALTGRQDGVIFTIYEDRAQTKVGSPAAPAYCVRASDTKGLGRSIDTRDLRHFELDGAKEFCQQIMAGEVDLEAMQAEIDAKQAAKEERAIMAATRRALAFWDKLEAAGITYSKLLELAAERDKLDGMTHNILLGYERGEGLPNV